MHLRKQQMMRSTIGTVLAIAGILWLSPVDGAAPEFVQIENFGGAGDNHTDNAPALDKAVEYSEQHDIRHIHFGVGRYVFKNAPVPFQSGVFIEGMNRSETQLVAEYDRSAAKNPGNFLKWTGGFTAPSLRGYTYAGNGGGLRNLNIIAADGTRGGIAVWIAPYTDAQRNTETAAPSGIVEIVNVEVHAEGRGNWNWGLYADGCGPVKLPTSPCPLKKGLYDLYVRGSVFTGSTQQEVAVNKGVFILFDQVGLFGDNTNRARYGLWVGNGSFAVRFNGFSDFPYLVTPDSEFVFINGKPCNGVCPADTAP